MQTISDLCNARYFINETKPCTDYIFDNTYFDETLTTKLDLVCENENKRNFLGTILILAMLFGSFIGGRIGDQYGRKKVFLAAILIAVPSIIIQVFLNSFEGQWTKKKSQPPGTLGVTIIHLCFVHPIFRFWFLVTFGNEVKKIQKYYIIFVYCLLGQMGKTEKNRKENHATKVTKISKTKRRKYGMNET